LIVPGVNTRPNSFGLNSDGSFVVEDVLPGTYRLQIRVTEPPDDPLDPNAAFHSSFSPEIGSLTTDVVVPEGPSDQPGQPFDAGEFTLQLKAEAKAGD
jgi:hypothetical protein